MFFVSFAHAARNLIWGDYSSKKKETASRSPHTFACALKSCWDIFCATCQMAWIFFCEITGRCRIVYRLVIIHQQTNVFCDFNWRQNFSRLALNSSNFQRPISTFYDRRLQTEKIKNVYTWCNWKSLRL